MDLTYLPLYVLLYPVPSTVISEFIENFEFIVSTFLLNYKQTDVMNFRYILKYVYVFLFPVERYFRIQRVGFQNIFPLRQL